MANEPLSPNLLPVSTAPVQDDGIDLVGVLAAIITEWRLGTITFLITLVAGIGIISALKPQFVAQATILPQAGHTQGDALASIFTTHGPGGLYVGLLKSRSVQDSVINSAGLLKLFHTSSYEAAREKLASKSSFQDSADNIVTISVRDESAQNAAMITNAYLDALHSLDERMGTSQSEETRMFFEIQLKNEREALAEAETRLQQTQQKTGLIQPEAQTNLGLNSIQNVRSQITDLQVKLAAILPGATEENPQVKNLRSQIAQLRGEESGLENGGRQPVGAAPSASTMPVAALDFQRAQRDVTFHTAQVTALANQYETARLTEDFGRSVFLVIDHAIAPEHKAWPPRRPFLLIAAFAAFIVALTVVILRLLLRRILNDPAQQKNLTALRGAFRRQ